MKVRSHEEFFLAAVRQASYSCDRGAVLKFDLVPSPLCADRREGGPIILVLLEEAPINAQHGGYRVKHF